MYGHARELVALFVMTMFLCSPSCIVNLFSAINIIKFEMEFLIYITGNVGLKTILAEDIPESFFTWSFRLLI